MADPIVRPVTASQYQNNQSQVTRLRANGGAVAPLPQKTTRSPLWKNPSSMGSPGIPSQGPSLMPSAPTGQQIAPSSVGPGPLMPPSMPATYGGANSHNTPNMNTYVAPGGRLSPGLGSDTPGLNGVMAAGQEKIDRRNLNQFGRSQLALGGAKPEVAPLAPTLPTLPSNSKFSVAPGQVKKTGGERSTIVVGLGGGRSALISAAAANKMAAAGYKPEDLHPDSPHNKGANEALRAAGNSLSSQRVEEFASSDAGQKQKLRREEETDRRILNRATNQKAPAVIAARDRETQRRENRLDLADAGQGGAPSKGGLGATLAKAKGFSESDVGKMATESYNNTEGRNGRDSGSTGVLNFLNRHENLSRSELEGLQAWVDTHPELGREKSPDAIAVRETIKKRLGASRGGGAKPATSAPLVPNMPTSRPPMTVNGTNVSLIPDQM